MQEGDRVKLTVEGTVRRIGRSQGLCYEVELDGKDYQNRRTVWVEHGEFEPVNKPQPRVDAVAPRSVPL